MYNSVTFQLQRCSCQVEELQERERDSERREVEVHGVTFFQTVSLARQPSKAVQDSFDTSGRG